MAREALLKEAPQPAATVAEPDHLGCLQDALAHRFAPQPRTERLDVPQDSHKTAVVQPCDDVAQPCAMLPQAGEHAHFDFTPLYFPRGRTARRPKRHHHAIRSQGQGQGRQFSGQGLWRWRVPPGHRFEVLLEEGHCAVASRLDPTPHGTRAYHVATVPPQQPRRRGKGHKDRERTAQELEFTTGPLMWLHPQCLIKGCYLWDRTPVGTPSDTASPADRAEQTHELALGKTFTTQRAPAGWAGRPSSRSLGAFGQHIFDHMASQHTR